MTLTGFTLAFLGFALAATTTAIWAQRLRAVRLPRNRAGFVVAWLGAVILGAAALVEGAGWLGGIPAVVAIAVGAFATFTVSISRQKAATDAIAVGDRLPPFGALDEFGNAFESASLAGSPVLIKFFRGHW